jgi:hypothetical protein
LHFNIRLCEAVLLREASLGAAPSIALKPMARNGYKMKSHVHVMH